MTEYKATDGDRLDQIVFNHYNTLKVFNKVLEANKHIGAKTVLAAGDVIKLPVIELPKTKEVKGLW